MKNNHFLFNIITIILLFAYSINGYSQPVTWYKTWGYPGVQRSETGKRVCQTYDDGYAVLTSVSNGGNDWYDLLKYDYLGNLQWINVIIDSTNYSRVLNDMQQTADSGFIFAGYSTGALLVKTDKNGNLKWQRNYTNLNSGTHFLAVQQTKDKGYIACGDYIDYVYPSMKGIVIKVDSLGYVQWEKQYMDSLFNSYSGIIQGLDKNYYIAGGTSTNQPVTFYSILKKLDTLGNVLYTKIYYSNGGGEYIIQLKDSSVIIGDQDITTDYPILVKFYPSGNLKWLKTYPTTYHFYFYYMFKDLFDNIIMTGIFDKISYSPIGNWKLDTSGTILKIKEVDYSGYLTIGSNCIKPTTDSGFILTGNANKNGDNNALIIKIDSAFNAPLITKIHTINSLILSKFKIYQNYPNPFNSTTSIGFDLPNNGFVKFILYDVLGKEVFFNEEYRSKGFNEKIMNMSDMNLSSGVYFVRISFELNSELVKLIYLK
jgi:hypothetical protein